MIDMKMSKEEVKEYNSPEVAMTDSDGERYPWCLRFDLNDEVLEKMGVTTLPAVGEEMMMTCKVKVIGTRQSASEGSDNRSVDLQITELDLPIGDAQDLEEGEEEDLTRNTSGPMSKVAQKLQNM